MKAWHRNKPHLRNERGQGLVEFALAIVLISLVGVISLALLGPSINKLYCKVIFQFGQFPDVCLDEGADIVALRTADYKSDKQTLHFDVTSNGTAEPGTTMTASPGGPMEMRKGHYHISLFLTGCPCEVTATSSQGGSLTVTVGP